MVKGSGKIDARCIEKTRIKLYAKLLDSEDVERRQRAEIDLAIPQGDIDAIVAIFKK
jgi:hypothetical protein